MNFGELGGLAFFALEEAHKVCTMIGVNCIVKLDSF